MPKKSVRTFRNAVSARLAKHFDQAQTWVSRKKSDVGHRHRLRKVLLWTFLIGVGLFFAAAITFAVTFAIFIKDLPSAEELRNVQIAQSTRILDREGSLLYELHGDERRRFVKLADMGPVPKATVAAEDASFYSHSGFDVPGIVRAGFMYARKKITGTGRIEGASTITQQFVKLAYLSSERTFTRKAKELILSMEVEQRFTKDEILELYLNTISFGSNAAGVEAAAEMYFTKSAKDLTLDEAAMLAAIPQSPTRLSPYGQNTEQLKARKQYVLRRMLETEAITKEQYDAALGIDTLAKVKKSKEFIKAPHFVFYVRELLEQKYGQAVAERGGLTVHTTLDPMMQEVGQRKVEELVARRAKADGISNAALVSIDPKTGQILSMVGSKDYFAKDYDGQVNVVTSLRQPGSSFKPLVYANFFRKGFGPGTILYDVETDFGGGYIPKNYSGKFSGNVTVRKALQGSLNIPAIKAFYIAGVDDSLNLIANNFGFKSVAEKPRDQVGLSAAIGAIEVQPLEMAQGFAVFAANGRFRPAIAWTKIVDSSGKVLEENLANDGTEVLDPQVAFLINDTLADCGSRPAGWGALCYESAGKRVAAKTGTSNRKIGEKFLPSDLWTLAYTPSISTAMWAGNNDGAPTYASADGLNTVAPLMKEYLLEVMNKRNIAREEFPKPEQVIRMEFSDITGLPGNGHEDWISSFGAEYLHSLREKHKGAVTRTAQVDESCGPAIASPFSPPSKVRTYVFLAGHDLLYYVRPDDPLVPNFERRVRGRSGEAGGVKYVGSLAEFPTTVCTKYDSSSLPQISFNAPRGRIVPGANDVSVSIQSLNPITSVGFLFDGAVFASMGSCTSCSATLNVPEGMTGNHTITVRVQDEVGFSNEASIGVSAENAPREELSVSVAAPSAVSAGSVFAVEARVNMPATVQIIVDGSLAATLTSPPYRTSVTAPNRPGERIAVRVQATSTDGDTASDSTNVRIEGGRAEPEPEPEPSSVPESSPPPPSSEPAALTVPSPQEPTALLKPKKKS